MKWAVLTLNKKSISQARKLKEFYDCDIYTMDKYLEEGLIPYKNGFKKSMPFIFKQYDVIIGIMAMGIIVRDITPHSKHKSIDPAVLCLSITGKYIIPVLSGHLGGANEIALDISRNLEAEPVITTASDLLNKKAVDLIAKERGLIIDSFKDAMDITARMINDEKIEIVEDKDLGTFSTKGVDGLIYIGNKVNNNFKIPSVSLISKNIVIGIGAKKDTPYIHIRTFLDKVLLENNISIKAVKLLSSIDLKKDENGILELSKTLNVPYKTYSSEDILPIENKFEFSDFVKKITGVGSVSMPSGYLGSNKGKCLVKRVADNGVTISVWEEIE